MRLSNARFISNPSKSSLPDIVNLFENYLDVINILVLLPNSWIRNRKLLKNPIKKNALPFFIVGKADFARQTGKTRLAGSVITH